ncbi:hypothetical protein MKW94_024148, partial [Papaver nudicaule]|nr:hypothetical protein [Papaver nudicaule]
MRRRGKIILLPYAFTLFFIAGLRPGSTAVGTTITPTQFITDPQTIVSSKDGIFRLGFFSLGDSRSRFVGIWYNNIPGPTLVWVANRDHPLNDSSGVLKIARDGNLVLLNGQGKLCWTTNVTGMVSGQVVAELLDTGNLVLRESSRNYNPNEGRYFWQSFDHPTDTFLPEMKFGVNFRTGEKQTITSWKNDSDPSAGDFTLELDSYVIPQLIIKNGSQRKWRSGPWWDDRFLGMDHPGSDFRLERDYVKGTLFLSLLFDGKSALSRIVLESDGQLVAKQWHEEKREWHIRWSSDTYSKCGPFGIYSQYSSQTCSCMRGFEPKFINEWENGNWSGGCVRRKDLQCEILSNKTSDQNSKRKADGFLALEMGYSNEGYSNVYVPDYFHLSESISYEQCHDKCLHDCQCTAYSYSIYHPNVGCMWWTGDLIDTHAVNLLGTYLLYIRVANSELDKEWNVEIVIIISLVGILLTSVGSYFCWIFMGKQIRSCLKWIRIQSGFMYCYFLYLIGNMKRGMRKSVEWEKRRRYRKNKQKNMRRSLVYSDDAHSYGREPSDSKMLIGENTELRVIDFKTLAIATNNFSEANKLGHGGFGPVYK